MSPRGENNINNINLVIHLKVSKNEKEIPIENLSGIFKDPRVQNNVPVLGTKNLENSIVQDFSPVSPTKKELQTEQKKEMKVNFCQKLRQWAKTPETETATAKAAQPLQGRARPRCRGRWLRRQRGHAAPRHAARAAGHALQHVLEHHYSLGDAGAGNIRGWRGHLESRKLTQTTPAAAQRPQPSRRWRR